MPAVSRPRFASPAKLLIIVMAVGLVFGLYRLVLYQSVSRHVHHLAHSIPGCTGIRYSRLSIPFFSLQARLSDATLDFANDIAPISVDSIHLRRFRPGDRLPRILDADLDGVTVNSVHPLVPFGKRLQDLGYHVMRGDLHIQWERRGDTQDAWDINLMLKLAEAGEMLLSTHLAKVNAEGVALALAKPYNWLMVLPVVELIELRCDYVDQGLFDRVMKAAAGAREQSPEAFREALRHQLQVQRQHEKDPDIQAVWQSLEAFCRHPGRISLRTDLTRPIPLGQLWWLRRPEDFIQRLALECRVG